MPLGHCAQLRTSVLCSLACFPALTQRNRRQSCAVRSGRSPVAFDQPPRAYLRRPDHSKCRLVCASLKAVRLQTGRRPEACARFQAEKQFTHLTWQRTREDYRGHLQLSK